MHLRWYTTAGPDEQETLVGIGTVKPGSEGEETVGPNMEALQTKH